MVLLVFDKTNFNTTPQNKFLANEVNKDRFVKLSSELKLLNMIDWVNSKTPLLHVRRSHYCRGTCWWQFLMATLPIAQHLRYTMSSAKEQRKPREVKSQKQSTLNPPTSITPNIASCSCTHYRAVTLIQIFTDLERTNSTNSSRTINPCWSRRRVSRILLPLHEKFQPQEINLAILVWGQ